MTAPTAVFWNRFRAHFSSPKFEFDAWSIVATATATSLHRSFWIPAIYNETVKDLPQSPAAPSPSPKAFVEDQLPRRRVNRRLKETIFKCIILSGVGSCIESSLALKDAVAPGDRDDSFQHEDYRLDDTNRERGTKGLDRVYKNNIHAIFDRFGSDMKDIQWLSKEVTYGLFLGGVAPEEPSACLTFQETELVVLSCLIAAQAKREVLWHLRGALRAGFTAEEVEHIQQAVEMIIRECGQDVSGLPRVGDVREEDDLR